MAKLSLKAGSTSQSVNVFIQDSSSTVGAGLTALAYNTASLVAYYTHAGANATATSISLATLAAVNSAYSSGGFKEISSTNMPGVYRLDLPDAVLATSKGPVVTVMLKGATNMAPCVFEIELTGWDNQDGVRGGMTALPNAVAGANGGLPLAVDSSGRVDVLKINGTSQTARDVGASVLLSSGTGTGQISLSSGTVTVGTNNDKTGYSLTQAFPTNFSTLAIDGSGRVDVAKIAGTSQTARDIGASVLLSSGTGIGQISLSSGTVTVGTNNDKTGYALSGTQTFNLTGDITGNLSGSVGSVTGNVGGNVVGSVGSVTADVTVGTNNDKTGYSLSSSQTFDLSGNVSGSVGSVTGNVGGNVSGSVGSVTGNVGGNVSGSVGSVVGNVGGNVGGNVVGSVASVVAAVDVDGTSSLSESYASAGAGFTLAQALYGLHALLGEKAIVGTTMTTKRRDGSTTANTFTLDDDTSPTSITQAT